jgi:hypothetical protein
LRVIATLLKVTPVTLSAELLTTISTIRSLFDPVHVCEKVTDVPGFALPFDFASKAIAIVVQLVFGRTLYDILRKALSNR